MYFILKLFKLTVYFDQNLVKLSGNFNQNMVKITGYFDQTIWKYLENMFRFIDLHLKDWVTSTIRKPLILRGARQVGKTFAVRKLGTSFQSYIEVNFEQAPHLKKIFDDEKSLDPKRILRDLSIAFNQEIIPGKTLLFFDEWQAIPRVIIALRYFYEEMPDIHIIAAGSLLDFAIEKVGVPVGRVEFYNLYPMSFLEFLKALGSDMIIKAILNHSIS